MKDLSRLIRDTQFLPPAFQIVPRLLLLLDDAENASTDELEKLIRVDAGLTTNLLAACNSAWFGAGSRAETLSDAIMRLGFHEVYRLLLKVISLPLLTKPQPDYGLDEANLWNHSLAVATAARFISQTRGQNEDLAFTAGLLHDVGKIAFTQIFKGEYQQLVLQSTSQQRPLTAIEKEHADLNHAEAGAELLSKWNFPENIMAAVRFHHEPMKAGEHCELAALIHVANLLAFYINQGSGHQSYVLFFDRACLDLLGLTPPMIEEFTPKIETAFEKELAAFI